MVRPTETQKAKDLRFAAATMTAVTHRRRTRTSVVAGGGEGQAQVEWPPGSLTYRLIPQRQLRSRFLSSPYLSLTY